MNLEPPESCRPLKKNAYGKKSEMCVFIHPPAGEGPGILKARCQAVKHPLIFRPYVLPSDNMKSSFSSSSFFGSLDFGSSVVRPDDKRIKTTANHPRSSRGTAAAVLRCGAAVHSRWILHTNQSVREDCFSYPFWYLPGPFPASPVLCQAPSWWRHP